MADEFVNCRLVDDHSVTQRVAVSALPYFPDWEPIPGEEEQPHPTVDPAAAENPAPDASETSEDEGSKSGGSRSKTTASKSASKTTDSSKGRGE
ncbi:hypothetical protein AB0C10_36450 [Microbispora amethystogenes]|uniref:hypothetical protein n=1 Tax=Microbispora amethystogenes TaxID=1427754 RepID=UPI0033F1E6AE